MIEKIGLSKGTGMSTNEIAPAATATRGRASTITLWVLQTLVGAFLIVVALQYLLGTGRFVRIFEMIGIGQWLRYFVGAVELIGGVCLFSPRLSGVAALGLSCVTLGGAITQLLVVGVTPVLLNPVTSTVALVLIVWGRWPETRSLIRQLKPQPARRIGP